jgi:cbb3-type cytochrome oxidase cytochrome c subunit
MPQNDEQKKDWIAKYDWHKAHSILQPMLPLQYTESSCIKCHKDQDRIPQADQLNKGRIAIESYGCYGCHKIEGWQHMKKPGPSLEKISSKISKEFIKNWIWSPHSFNPESRMPAFFNQANNSKPEFMRLNIAEVNAMAEYIVSKSKPYVPFAKYVPGDAEKGKALVQSIGCIGCHQIAGIDEPYSKTPSKRGPNLVHLGSKLSGDWLVSWLQKPSHYQADTIMPEFRLSTSEANDIAAFLLSSKNKTFEQLSFQSLDKKAVDELLVDYFSSFDPKAEAEKQLSKLSESERVMELGRRSINKYGCYSCHSIEGFPDNLPPIGPELTAVGSKDVKKFGWGHEHHLNQTRDSWIWHHLQQPSRWDIGVAKVFKDLNRMPNYYLAPEEITTITGYLLGLVNEYVPMSGMKNLSAAEKVAEEGKKILTKYNCQGCHTVDSHLAAVDDVYKDDLNAGPPWLMNEGHRVQSEWLYKFLQGVFPIRKYLAVRMPSFSFTNDELNKIVAYFQAQAHEPSFLETTSVEWEVGEKEAAQKMFTELACTSCHTAGFNTESAQGPDLHQVGLRLRSSWIEKWLTNPQAIMPYTPMPNFWDSGKVSAVPGVLGDDPQKQIKALTKYIIEMSSSSYPQGYKPRNVMKAKE